MTINEILEKRKSIHSFTDEVISNEQIEEMPVCIIGKVIELRAKF